MASETAWVASPPSPCYANKEMARIRIVFLFACGSVGGGLAAGLLVVLLAAPGCGQQNIQGCSPPGLKPSPPAISATNVGSIGQTQGGGSSMPTTVRPTVTFDQPMNPATLTPATIELQVCGAQGQPGGGCSTSSPVKGSVAYDACTATATFTPAQPLAAGTEHVLGVPICTSSDGLCSVSTLARDTSGRPMMAAGGLCGSLTNVVCVVFNTGVGGPF